MYLVKVQNKVLKFQNQKNVPASCHSKTKGYKHSKNKSFTIFKTMIAGNKLIRCTINIKQFRF